jgi:phosphonate transport system permease protein
MTTADRIYVLPSQRYKRKLTMTIIAGIVLVGICTFYEFNPTLLLTEFHYVISLLDEMLPPNFSILWTNKSIGISVLQTISMAFLGTLIGGTIALGLSFLAATNTTPSQPLRLVVKALLSFERVTPSLVIILIFVISVGLGAFAGMLTLALGTIGMFGKLFSEALENAHHPPAEAIYSVGATKVQVIRYAILPQVLPSFIANFLYAFDINMRAAIGLGIFGGGGIGFELHMSMKVLRYPDALALIFFTILLVTAVEKVSDLLRKKILTEGKLK